VLHRLRARVRRLRTPSEISQAGLRHFLEEVGRRPDLELPREAPASLSVVVPCFGHAAYLPDMLESIVAQTRQPDEVVFVDDGSPDETKVVLTAFIAAQKLPDSVRLLLLENDRNMGQSASINRAISVASGELIMIANDDDYLMHDAIESMLGLFAQNREVAMIGAHSIHFAGSEALAAAPKLSTAYGPPERPLVIHRPKDVLRYRAANDLNMTHSGSCFLKSAWAVVGGYRPDKSERIVPYSDRDFQLRVNAVWPVAVAYETPFSFWRNDSSLDSGRDS